MKQTAIVATALALLFSTVAVGQESGGAQDVLPEQPGSVVSPESDEQPAVPRETDILLPSMLLRVQEVELDRVAAELPDSPPVELPDIQGPLPSGGAAESRAAAIELPDPGGPGFTAETREEQASLFSRGVLGIGSMNQILGSLSLYRLGVDPRLQFEFSHEDMDGYQSNEPGDGFFQQSNSLTGSVELSSQRAELSTEAAFVQHEEGMQENPDFYSVKRRRLSGSAGASYTAADRLTLKSSIAGGATERIFTIRSAESPRRDEELRFSPSAGAEVTFEPFTGALDVDYHLMALGGSGSHLFIPRLRSELSFPNSLLIAASGGVAWDFGDYLRVPFSMELSGTLGNDLTLNARGGYQVEPFSFHELWQTELLAGLPENVPKPEERFFGELSWSWNIAGDSLRLDFGVEGDYALNALDIMSFDDASDTFPLVRDDEIGLSPRLQLSWRLGVLHLDAGWRGELLERAEWEARQSYRVTLELRDIAQRFGGSVSGALPVYSEAVMPKLSASAYAELTEGIRIVGEVEDMLAPVMKNGRPQIGSEVTESYPFIQPGFRVIIKTELSL